MLYILQSKTWKYHKDFEIVLIEEMIKNIRVFVGANYLI